MVLYHIPQRSALSLWRNPPTRFFIYTKPCTHIFHLTNFQNPKPNINTKRRLHTFYLVLLFWIVGCAKEMRCELSCSWSWLILLARLVWTWVWFWFEMEVVFVVSVRKGIIRLLVSVGWFNMRAPLILSCVRLDSKVHILLFFPFICYKRICHIT